MELLYIVCAILGGTLLLCQFVMTLVGLGHHGDLGVDHHDGFEAGHDVHDGHHHVGHESTTAWFVGILTFRTIVAAITFFGLAGLAASSAGLHALTGLLIALAAGTAALLLVGFLMKGLYGLRADGTARIERSVGKYGTVYLRVPGNKSGIGKVTLNLQNRTVEMQAMTPEQDLPAGSKVVVVGVVSPDTVEVLASTEPERSDRSWRFVRALAYVKRPGLAAHTDYRFGAAGLRHQRPAAVVAVGIDQKEAFLLRQLVELRIEGHQVHAVEEAVVGKDQRNRLGGIDRFRHDQAIGALLSADLNRLVSQDARASGLGDASRRWGHRRLGAADDRDDYQQRMQRSAEVVHVREAGGTIVPGSAY